MISGRLTTNLAHYPHIGIPPSHNCLPVRRNPNLILTIVFVLVTSAILDRRAFGWPELTEVTKSSWQSKGGRFLMKLSLGNG
ncbi:unnamed protein product, partial [Vitis vinifera]|uniref:Uncharacterized protein n=1 Tax=Vitis vinifera TaxID=29760 RepID=D7TSL7_VITVI